MVQFRPQTREIIAKIVYYGPPLGGKTTNLRTLYLGYPKTARGELVVVPTGTDRTIFFDFLPISAGELRGMALRVQLYTVPGQVHYNSTRQVVLRGVDGVVFVADSQRVLLRNDRDSWENLKDNLLLQGVTLADLPHVLQYNKRDLEGAVSLEDIDHTLNEYNAPFYDAIATQGIGVEETLQGIVKLVARSLRDRFRVSPESPGVRPAPVAVPPVVAPAPAAEPGARVFSFAAPATPPAPAPAPATVPVPAPPAPEPAPVSAADVARPSEPAAEVVEAPVATAEPEPVVEPEPVATPSLVFEPPPPTDEEVFAGAFAAPSVEAETAVHTFETLGEAASLSVAQAQEVPGFPAAAEPEEALHAEVTHKVKVSGVFSEARGTPPEPAAAVAPEPTPAPPFEPLPEPFVTAPVTLEPFAAAAVPAPAGFDLFDPFELHQALTLPVPALVQAGEDDVFAIPAPLVMAPPEPEPEPEPELEPAPAPEPAVAPAFSATATLEPESDEPAALEASAAASLAVQRIMPRAIAQYGEVRELELEVPVPSVWVGGRRMTLQLRLTLVPQEE